ncbi:hypothetical protein [Microbacterium atlanticum]|uniref:hypothetical protein n=1 Tax=Microbacterium atlanticum TaxID=2782168 RepID=UPI0018875B6D|nr:hypothetical protein [Microbacterium atlanticum]
MTRRIGAYILPADVVWLEKTLGRYYGLVDVIVVPVPVDGRGWTGAPIPVDAALAVIDRVDERRIARRLEGRWTDEANPMRADTAQRQAALDALADEVDWVIQLDNDELLPDTAALLGAIDEAERRGLDAVEWPMRVLYRRTTRRVWEVVGSRLEPRYDFPGAVAVRPKVRLTDARRVEGSFLRPVVRGDSSSLQLTRPAEDGEHRWISLPPEAAVIHNSWARRPHEIRQKTRSWGHANGWRGTLYYFAVWLPVPLTWRWLRDVHPFARGLWPRLQPRPLSPPERD